MSVHIDITKTYAVAYSPAKLFGLLVGAVALVAAGIFVPFKMGNSHNPRVVLAYVGIVLFGACSVLILYRLLTQRGHVVTISPEGIKDLRVAARIIPWSAIRGISTWSQSRQRFMVLAVDPDAEKALGLTRKTRWSRMVNKAIGADGLVINSIGLDISYHQLLRITLAYAAAAEHKRASA